MAMFRFYGAQIIKEIRRIRIVRFYRQFRSFLAIFRRFFVDFCQIVFTGAKTAVAVSLNGRLLPFLSLVSSLFPFLVGSFLLEDQGLLFLAKFVLPDVVENDVELLGQVAFRLRDLRTFGIDWQIRTVRSPVEPVLVFFDLFVQHLVQADVSEDFMSWKSKEFIVRLKEKRN